MPGVFHPGFFSSTVMLLDFLCEQKIAGQSLIEVGCGTGLISIIASKAGAEVTAIDLSTKAIENTTRNVALNNTNLNIVQSDLFRNVDSRKFDWVMINPPYYPQRPSSEENFAWYCGEQFEYFQRLFSELKNFIHQQTRVIMVLTKGCDLERIFSIASARGFKFEMLREKKVLFDEKDFLYEIRPH